jgi:hypothetical protein
MVAIHVRLDWLIAARAPEVRLQCTEQAGVITQPERIGNVDQCVVQRTGVSARHGGTHDTSACCEAINTWQSYGGSMRLDEIKAASAAEQRVKRMKASAKAAKERARQLTVQADATAERLEMQQARQKVGQLQRAAVATSIKPYT